MKLALFTAAALLASPAFAQTTPAGGGDTMSTPAPQQQQATPPGGDTMSTTAPAGQTAPAGADPVGGYQPAMAPNAGPPPAGATVTYQQAQTPDQAYPAPAPMAKYPVCKAGQYDDCMQGSAVHKMGGHKKMMHHRK